MNYPANAFNVRFLGKVATVALFAGLSAGCSADIDRFASFENPFERTSNQAQIVQPDASVTGSVQAAPTTAVQSGSLPPPPITAAPPQMAAAQPMATAPTVAATPAVHAAAPVGGEVYVVKPGDSLGRIANDRGLRSIDVASFNGIDPAAPIKVGQKLRIPAGATPATQVAALDTQTKTDAVTGAPPAPLGNLPVAAPAPGQPVATDPAVPTQPTQPAPTQVAVTAPPVQTQPQMPTGAGVESSTAGNFRWPVRGRVVSGFGVKANGERNDGINIEVPEGTPIKAAEGGTVIYAGNELKGYGNLVLVKHPNGMVTAYAHASEMLVKRDDVVMRGQTLGKVGTTGNVPRPQLHFEIREGNKPVDPIPFLAG